MFTGDLDVFTVSKKKIMSHKISLYHSCEHLKWIKTIRIYGLCILDNGQTNFSSTITTTTMYAMNVVKTTGCPFDCIDRTIYIAWSSVSNRQRLLCYMTTRCQLCCKNLGGVVIGAATCCKFIKSWKLQKPFLRWYGFFFPLIYKFSHYAVVDLMVQCSILAMSFFICCLYSTMCYCNSPC